MSTFNLSADNKSLSIEIVVTDNDFAFQGRTFYSPSITCPSGSGAIKFFECGIYKTQLLLNEIGTVGDNPAPTTIEQAYQDIKNLISSIGTI